MGERIGYSGEMAADRLPVRHLVRGVPLRSITPDVVTARTREELEVNPGGFVGTLTDRELAALMPQFDYLGCGFAPGVRAEIFGADEGHRLRIAGNTVRFGRPQRDEIVLDLANHPKVRGLHVVEHSGVPFYLRPAIPKMDSLLRAQMSRVVGDRVEGLQIGPRHVSAVIGFKAA